MDSASQSAEETTKSGDDKNSQASSTASLTITQPAITTTSPTTTTATVTSSIDSTNEVDITKQATAQVAIGSTSSSSSSFSSTSPSSSLPAPNGNSRIKSDENKESYSDDKDQESRRRVDERAEFKSQSNDQKQPGEHVIDSQTAQQTNSCQTESKSSSNREGHSLSSSSASSSLVAGAEKFDVVKVDTTQPTVGSKSELSYNCSDSISYKLNCPKPGSNMEISQPGGGIAPSTESSLSSTLPSSCNKLNKSMTTSASPPQVSTSSTEINKSEEEKEDSQIVTKGRLQEPVDASVSCENASVTKTMPEPPTSTISINKESDRYRQTEKTNEKLLPNASTRENVPATASEAHASTMKLESMSPVAASSSNNATSSHHSNYTSTNSMLDRNKQFEIRSMEESSCKKVNDAAPSEASTTTFTDRRLSDSSKTIEITAAVMPRRIDNIGPNSSASSSDLCNYSSKEALGDKSKEVPASSSKTNATPQESQIAHCTSSSSNSGGQDVRSNESSRMSPKYSDVVDSSTSHNNRPQTPPTLTTPVIASTSANASSTPQNDEMVGQAAIRIDSQTRPSLNSNRRASNSSDHAHQTAPLALAAADSNNQQTNGVQERSQVLAKINSTESRRNDMEAVSSSNYSIIKSNSIESKRPSLTEDQRNEFGIISEEVDKKTHSNIITYQTSNQAIVASTIRQLFKRSASEEGRLEQRPMLAPPKVQVNAANNNHNILPTRVTPTQNSQHSQRETSPYYYPTERVTQIQQPARPVQQMTRQLNKDSSDTRSESISSASPKSSYYQPPKSGPESYSNYPPPVSMHNSNISSSTTTLSSSNRLEKSSSSEAGSSLENFPRIPAMVDTVLAMKKTKPESERRYNAMQQKEFHQTQYMQAEPSHPQQSHPSYSNSRPGNEQSARRNQIYVENPDFTKITHSGPPQKQASSTAASAHHPSNLSQLHMKPPDFSKIKEAKPKSITPENFAEMSKKFNYVKDLRLKNPPGQESLHEKTPYNNLYMKAPEFSTQKFQSKSAESSPHAYNSKSEYQQNLTMHFPQLSDDVVMSVVPTKPANQPHYASLPEKKTSELHDRAKHYPPVSYPNAVQLQPREHSSPSDHHPHIIPAGSKLPEHREYAPMYNQKQTHSQPQPPSGSSLQRQYYAQSSYPTQQSHHPHHQQIPTSQPSGAAVTSVIQSSRSKERAVEYPQPKPQERPVVSPNYYQYLPQPQQQQQPPHPGSSSYSKNPSPSLVAGGRQYPAQSTIIQQAPSPVNSAPSTPSNKPVASPNTMNPPCGWPSQSNSRVGHSPVASPHTPYHRVSQSPVGMNAPSPHSPSFLQPSPKASPSPTHISRVPPAQNQCVPSSVSYKNPYMYPPQPEPLPNNKASFYGGPAPLPQKPQYDRQYSEQPKAPSKPEGLPLLPSEYMMSQLPAKANTSRQPERDDSVYASSSSSRLSDPSKAIHNYNKSGGNKLQEKPNYREMINSAYALRNSTTEEDLNYKIIQRTLKKDISIHRSENDLSKSIFDTMPGPPVKNSSSLHFSRSAESLNSSRVPDPHGKYVYHQDYNVGKGFPASHSGSGSIVSGSSNIAKSTSNNKLSHLPICNDLTRNDISVTVSKVVKPPDERPKPTETHVHPAPRSSYVDNKELSAVVISKMKTAPVTEARNAYASRTRPPEPPPPAIPKPVATSSTASKRESPLDLSVKTVKTKADSTGCDDSAYAPRSSLASTLKFDFAPNFSKHVRNMTQAESPPTAAAQQPSNQQSVNRNPYAPGTSRQYSYEPTAAPQVQKASVLPPQKEMYNTNYPPRHKPNEQPPVQYQSSYGQPQSHKAYPVVAQPGTSHQEDRSLQYRMGQPSGASFAPKYDQKPSDERPKIIEVDQTRKVQIPPPTKEVQYQDYGRQQPVPPQQYERLPSQQHPSHVLYKDQRYADTTSLKCREAYPTSDAHESRQDDYARRTEAVAHNPPVLPPNAQHGRMHEVQYNNRELEQKRQEESKAFAVNARRNNQYSNDPYASRKRPQDNLPPQVPGSSSHYHPPEKQVRVDELYRAHLAQTQHVQQQQQLHQQQMLQQQHHRQQEQQRINAQMYRTDPSSHTNHYEKGDASVLRKDGTHPGGPHYPSQAQYHGAPYKPPPTPQQGYPVHHPQPQSDRQMQPQSNIPPANSQMQQYPQNVHVDRIGGHPHTAVPHRNVQPAHSIPPGLQTQNAPHQQQNSAQHAPVTYQPSQNIYPTSHTAVNPPQSHIAHSNIPPNMQPRQSPHQSHESAAKPIPSHEAPPVHNSLPPSQPKYISQDIQHRSQSGHMQHNNQVFHPRLSSEYPPHRRGEFYPNNQHKYSIQASSQDAPSSNAHIHAPSEPREHHKGNHTRPEYPPSNDIAMSYQTSVNRNRELPAPPQQNSTWYPPVPMEADPGKREPPKESSSTFQSNQYPPATPSSTFSSEPSPKIVQARPTPAIVAKAPSEVSPAQIPQSQPVTATPHRGADQNVIEKLRTSIEMREFEKQKLLNRKQMNGEIQEDEPHKNDIASLLAARIRTKGELKGYTPIPTPEEKPAPEERVEEKKEVLEEPAKPPVLDPFSDEDPGQSAFDLMDWGSTCNDFVEQLQTGVKKRAGKKRKAQSIISNEPSDNALSNVESKENLPGVVYNGDIEQSLVEKIKLETMEAEKLKPDGKSQQESSSSDEDKPLHLLRQQSLTDVGKCGSDKESSAQQTVTTDIKLEDLEDRSMSGTGQKSHPTSDCSSERAAARTVREKQRLQQERRLAARLSKTSSSESDEETKRSLQRPKKLTRKPRSRASGASTTRDSTDSDSSDGEAEKRNLIRERLETRKRKLAVEKVSSSSEPQANKKLITNVVVDENDRKIKLPIPITPSSVVLKREIITKAQIKCMKLPSEKSESSDEEMDSSKKTVESKEESLNDKKDVSEDETNVSQEQTSSPAVKSKTPAKKAKPFETPKIEETMTRSKRKKELQEQLANSKVLRNEKVIQNTPIKPSPAKSKPNDKTPPLRVTRSVEQKSSEEKVKPQISTRSSKNEKVEDSKRKLCGNESDDKARKRPNKPAKEESSLSSSEGNSDAEPKTVSERLLLRRSRLSNESVEKTPEPRKTRSSDRAKAETESKKPPVVQKTPTPSKKPQVTTGKQKVAPAETNTDKFPPGWELEVYQYKRALKVPQSLITIKGPAHHRVSTSLPDLDPHSSDASESFSTDNLKVNSKHFSEKNKKDNKSIRLEPTKSHKKSLKVATQPEDEASNDVPESLEGKSIIDILHQRVPFSRRQKDKKLTRNLGRNEPRVLPRSSNQTELLPTPKTSNIYRGENHHIREIFGGEDRPASAPPELTDSKEEIEPRMTFAKKYEEYLAAMNDVDFANRIRKNKKISSEALMEETSRSSMLDVPIKKEKLDEFVPNQDDDETQDTEINACLQNAVELKTEPMDTNERDTPSIVSEHGDGVVTPILFKRKKSSKMRSSRRKGSSGFDYIRKKKKPAPSNSNGQEVVKRKRISPVELLNTRDENDISKEIQRWVLNKGVGQSALHKAARLGYIDVIAYCLERMGLNPDPKDNAGYTPLHEACSKGRLDIARLLLQYGANHSEVAASGIRPLHEASENGYVEIVRLLLSYGADPLVTTYSGQTPLMLAESSEMEQFIKNHLHDVQNTGPHKQPWKFPGPWYIYDPDVCGFNELDGVPDDNDDCDDMDDSQINKVTSTTAGTELIRSDDTPSIQDARDKCDTNSNSILSTYDERPRQPNERVIFKNKLKTNCTVVLNSIESIERISTVKQFKDYQSKSVQRRRSTNDGRDDRTDIGEETDGDGEIFEFEESDIPLPPLYLLKDEGSEKWVMLSDLCSLLKVKSKDTLLKQISPSLPPPTNKELLRELKMSDFLEKATCLQLLCAGEKLNIRSSKVVLVKYNESVRNLLGVKTILMKF